MTYSLVVRDEDGSFGVVTASKSLAVGASVPAVAAGTGALVTQAYTNTTFAERGMARLRAGSDAAHTLECLVSSDPGRSMRQLAVLGREGEAAAWTGPDCTGAAGHLLGPGCVAAGNCLEDREVLNAMRDTFLGTAGALAHRLVTALASGEEAGGDHRGRQSAALRVAGPDHDGTPHSTARIDLRVDDHPDPVHELRRLLALHNTLTDTPQPTRHGR